MLAQVASSTTVTLNPAAVAICSSWLGDSTTVAPSISAWRAAADTGADPNSPITRTAGVNATNNLRAVVARNDMRLSSRSRSIGAGVPWFRNVRGQAVFSGTGSD